MTTTTIESACAVCGSTNGEVIRAREMMFGTREQFRYFECRECGCLRLLDVPMDLAQYYPKGYYSFKPPFLIPARSGFKYWMNRCRNAGGLFGYGPLSWLLSKLRPGPELSGLSRLLEHTGIKSFDAPILDVGCGAGELLSDLADAGFEHVVGVDPFASPRTDAGGRLRVLACTLDQLQETGFALVMSHHSLEHTLDQVGTLSQMRRVMKDNGVCLVRIPVTGTEPWQRYREHWVELDPPRHLVVQSLRSFEIVAKAAGLKVERVVFEETAFGYWGSELYQLDMSLIDPATGRFRHSESQFAAEKLAEFERLAQAANARSDGGRAAFYLRKA